MAFQAEGLTNYILDKFIAPELSKIDTCDAEDITSEGGSLMPLLLNQIFVLRFSQRELSFMVNYVWRVDQAVDDYRLAREILIELSARKNQAPLLYYRCLHHFLQSVSLLYQSMSLLMRFVEFTGAPPFRLFQKEDGSKEQRLNSIYNAWKHSESQIADGRIPAEGSLPVWLIKNGIKSTQCELCSAELREMLLDYQKHAKWQSEELPRWILEHRHGEAEAGSEPEAPQESV